MMLLQCAFQGSGGGSIRSAAQTVMRSATDACVVPMRGARARVPTRSARMAPK